jgi:urease accessory protein
LLAGQAGVSWAVTEHAIAASLIMIGLTLAASLRVPLPAAAGVCALSGFFHGLAHGAELTASNPSATAGLIAATVLLHAIGFALMRLAAARSNWLSRVLGAGVGVVGIALAAQLA